MGKSLREQLLDQMVLLQERGLAPSEVPEDEEAPLVVVETAPRGRSTRPRRESLDRYNEREELGLDANGEFDRGRRRVAKRDLRGDEAGERRRQPRGRGRPPGRGREEGDLVGPPVGVPIGIGGDRPMGPRRPFAPMGPRLDRPGIGGPRGPLPPHPPGRTEMLQQRAEQRRRDEEDIAEMRRLLAEFGGQEYGDEEMDQFSRELAHETGALPPPRIVVEAIRQSQTADPRKIGDAVRAYYRRSRSVRPPAPPPTPSEPVAASA